MNNDLKYSSCLNAVHHGDLDQLIKLYQSNYHLDKTVFYSAIKRGHFHIVKYCIENNCMTFEPLDAMITAAQYGHLDMIKYFLEKGFPLEEMVPANAVYGGHLNIVKFCLSKGCSLWKNSTLYAAQKGYLELLKYCHSNGCNLDASVAAIASYNGHLECLRYILENGCNLNDITVLYAFERGHTECLKYCFQMYKNKKRFIGVLKYPIPYNSQDKNVEDLRKQIDKIDLDDPIWRELFNINLNEHPYLKERVDSKKQLIQQIKNSTLNILETILPLDIIQYCIHPFF
jgi:hypothetical protein